MEETGRVLAAIGGTAPCDVQTVHTASALLNIQLTSICDDIAVYTKSYGSAFSDKGQKTSVRRQQKKPTTGKLVSAPRALSSSQRNVFATEVLNLSLRNLTQSIRNSGPASEAPQDDDDQRNGTKDALAAAGVSRLTAIVYCARVAFACLRNSFDDNTSAQSRQVEAGMISLVGKLIALRLFKAATKELYFLFVWTRRGMNTKRARTPAKFVYISANHMLHDFAISSGDDLTSTFLNAQTYAIRLMVSENVDLDEILGNVRLMRESSPLHLIERAHLNGLITRQERSKLFTTLAKALAEAMMMTKGTPTERKKDDATTYLRLECKVLVLEMQRRASATSGSRPDDLQATARPLLKTLLSMKKASTMLPAKIARSIADIVECQLKEVVANDSLGSGEVPEMKELKWYASYFRKPRGAQTAVKDSVPQNVSTSSTAERPNDIESLADAAVSMLKTTEKADNEISQSLHTLSRRICEELEKSDTRSDVISGDLIVYLSTIRRLSYRTLQLQTMELDRSSSASEAQTEVKGYVDIILTIPRAFVSVFEDSKRSKNLDNYREVVDRRVLLVDKVSGPTINAVLAVSKIIIYFDKSWITPYLQSVNECAQIMNFLEQLAHEGAVSGNDKRPKDVHIRLSDCLTSLFIKQQSSKATSGDGLNLLRLAVDLLLPRPSAERSAGNITGKVERLTRELIASNNTKSALELLESAVRCSCFDLNRMLASISSRESSHGTVDGPMTLEKLEFDLRRLLDRHLKISTKFTGTFLFFALMPEQVVLEDGVFQMTIDHQLGSALELFQTLVESRSSIILACSELLVSHKFKVAPKLKQAEWLNRCLQMLALDKTDAYSEVLNRCEAALSEEMHTGDMSDIENWLVADCYLNLSTLRHEAGCDNISSALDRLAECTSALEGNSLKLKPFLHKYHHERIEVLADFFAYHQMPQSVCRCLEVLLKLQTILLQTNSAINATKRRLAGQYLELGWNLPARDLMNTMLNEELFIAQDGVKIEELESLVLEMKLASSLRQRERMQELASKCLRTVKLLQSTIKDELKTSTGNLQLTEAHIPLFAAATVASRISQDITNYAHYAIAYVKATMTSLKFKQDKDLIKEAVGHTDEKLGFVTAQCTDTNAELICNDWRKKTKKIKNLQATCVVIAALLQLSELLSNSGQVAEARTHLASANELAAKSQSCGWKDRTASLAMHYDLLERGQVSGFGDAPPLYPLWPHSARFHDLESTLSIVEDYTKLQDWQSAGSTATLVLQAAQQIASGEDLRSKQPEAILTHRLNKMSLKDKASETTAKSSIRDKNAKGRKLENGDDSLLKVMEGPGGSHSNIQTLCSKARLHLAYISAAQNDQGLTADSCLQKDLDRVAVTDPLFFYEMTSRMSLSTTMEQISADPSLNLITETPLSFPNSCRNESLGLVEALAKPAGSMRPSRPRRQQSKKASQKSSSIPNAVASLDVMRRNLEDALRVSIRTHPTFRTHYTADHLFKMFMLTAALVQDLCCQAHPFSLLFDLEFGRNVAWQRYTAYNIAKRETSPLALKEPSSSLSEDRDRVISSGCTPENFSQRYGDLLPQNWNIVSLSLSEDGRDLHLARQRHGQKPFILSIPLNRNSDDTESDKFDFCACKAELMEIIALANQTSHANEALGRRGAKSDWWKTRTDLDERMRSLLISMDELWIGGFRGLFKNTGVCSTSFDVFKKAVVDVFTKNLPSRTGNRNRDANRFVALDDQVLQLIIDLGCPTADGSLDDPILDLLSFAVDIMSFKGETNAYDEIDFDAMTVEIVEALRIYHHNASTPSTIREKGHTILVLDRRLHCFPWESLPSLECLSVSRLPSLEALRDIFMSQRWQAHSAEGLLQLQIDSRRGSYILNPAGDLQHTETVFEKPLAKLPLTWNCIARRAPEEIEIQQMLSSSDLYLYFGHGSGAQYIRANTIKKIDNCAVSILLGCSSALVTDHGSFESTGTPFTYLQAGSSAVLGTLWDVTDRDIDQFSLSVLTDWGLFAPSEGSQRSDESSDSSKTKRARKTTNTKVNDSRSRTSANSDQSTRKSLNEAVANARGQCKMRYLNGAAPVVYGVPVYLK